MPAPGKSATIIPIHHLLRRNPNIWRGSEMAGQGKRGHPTGYPQLDAILPTRGWPQNAMMEIITPHWGMGELQLLMPFMRSITEQGKWILWISPPYLLYAPALVRASIDIKQVLVVQLENSCKEVLWTIEKALQTESCGLVLAWQNWLPNKVIRRLQLAAESGQTLGALFHHRDSKDSLSSLRLRINPVSDQNYQSTRIEILKAKGSYRSLSTVINLYD